MAQHQAVTEAVSYIVANKKTVFFASFLMQSKPKMRIVVADTLVTADGRTIENKTAATDGVTIYVSKWWLDLPILERVFVLCHEVLHAILAHMPRSTAYAKRGFGMDLKPFSWQRANKAQDYVINAALMESRIGTMPRIGLYRARGDAQRTWDDVYMELPDEDDDSGDGSGGDGSGGNGSLDQHLPAPNGGQVDERAHKQSVAQARNAAKAAGELPGGLARIIDGVLNPAVPWKDVLRDFLSAHAGQDESTWRRLNRRRLVTPPGLAFPGKDGFRMEGIVVAIDTSGSIGPDELKAFLGELKAILTDVAPREVHLLWWDTQAVHKEVESDDIDSIESLEAYGGGGTNYACVPKKIGELDLDPEAVVCLTDGYVAWPDESEIRWPHITVSTSDHEAPFGINTQIHVPR